ncbi:MAG: methylated-DNA--[protein]-cysteine S-methyltransferase [Acidobacteriia bacterium]|nr:methylated-DNA--[protein]-cysteine S-methyltransferase [Terriglobia bacterium]
MAVGFARLETPVGALWLFAMDGALAGLAFEDRRAALKSHLNRRFGGQVIEEVEDPAGAVSRLAAYFTGDLEAIDAIRVDPGGTPFQRAVWSALRRIPAGRTVAYSELASLSGHPRAVRAVDLANARNPIAIVVPCHRVIGADGSLTGYGGGLERKAWLLSHEHVLL